MFTDPGKENRMDSELIIAKWKRTLAEDGPAGSIELDDLDEYLGASWACTVGCNCPSCTSCCSGGSCGSSACCQK